jgi:hypothetical protein
MFNLKIMRQLTDITFFYRTKDADNANLFRALAKGRPLTMKGRERAIPLMNRISVHRITQWKWKSKRPGVQKIQTRLHEQFILQGVP